MLDKVKQTWESLRPQRFLTLPIMGAGAVLLTALIVLALWRSNQGYTALFGSQEQIPVSQVVEVLGGESIAYRVNPTNGQILVPENDLAKARMVLASKGIKAVTPSGYELMDKDEMLGSSQFIQNVRYKRSLEGELAQSIMTLDPVESARVHLGLSESSSFVLNNRSESSASVVVRLKYGQKLNDEQVASIIQLVAGSVPGMQSSMVRVVDQQGNLLSDGIQAGNGSTINVKNGSEIAKRLQQQTEQSIARLLNSVVGENNYRVSVSVNMDLSNVEETQERYLGEPRVNSENLNQENTSEPLALGIPGSLSNRAPNQQADLDEGEHAGASRSQAQRQYAYDRDIRHIRHPGYRLEKMTVAVVLNQDSAQLKAWTQDQFTQLNKLLSDAAGVNPERGDSLTLSRMAFMKHQPIEEPELTWWQDPIITDWIIRGVIGLLALILVIFGIIPTLRRVAQRKQEPAVPDATAQAEPEIDAQQLADEKAAAQIAQGVSRATFSNENDWPPASSGLETKIEHLQMLAQMETERVAEVIKHWINGNNNERTTPGTKQES